MRSQIQVTLGQMGFPANRHIPSGSLATSPVQARVPWNTMRLRRLKSLFSLEDSVPGRCKKEVKADGLQGGTGKEALGSIRYTCMFWKNWKCSTEGGRDHWGGGPGLGSSSHGVNGPGQDGVKP